MEKIEKRLKTKPVLGKNIFIAHNATVIGDINIGDESSIWFHVTIRADVNYIKIGNFSNIQDNSVIHVTLNKFPTVIGDYVTIGHNVTLHGCTIKNNCLIGIGAIIMDNSTIEKNSIVAAGTLIPPGKSYPPNVLIKGYPGKIVKELSEKEVENIKDYALRYKKYKDIYLANF